MNISLAKGVMCERVLIAPTSGITRYVQLGTYLETVAAAKFYVAVTRVAQSVAIIVDNPGDSSLPYWDPEQTSLISAAPDPASAYTTAWQVNAKRWVSGVSPAR